LFMAPSSQSLEPPQNPGRFTNEITGVLCSGEGIFLQVLEGERSAVNKLYVDICKDQRHTDIELLHFEEVTQRAFYAWSMDHIPVSTLYAMIQIQNPEFDPYLSSGKLALNCVIGIPPI